MKTKEELQNVRRSESVQPASSSSPSSSSSSSSDSESDHERSEENSTHSAELQTQDLGNHPEVERLTEAEKNKQLQEKLKVSRRPGEENGPASWACLVSVSRLLREFANNLGISSPSAGPEFRAGTIPVREQEDSERPAPRQKHPGGTRQVQNPAPDPSGQHQAADRRVRGLVGALADPKLSPEGLAKAPHGHARPPEFTKPARASASTRPRLWSRFSSRTL